MSSKKSGGPAGGGADASSQASGGSPGDASASNKAAGTCLAELNRKHPFFREFERRLDRGHSITLAQLVGVLEIMPNHSVGDFPLDLLEKWYAYCAANASASNALELSLEACRSAYGHGFDSSTGAEPGDVDVFLEVKAVYRPRHQKGAAAGGKGGGEGGGELPAPTRSNEKKPRAQK